MKATCLIVAVVSVLLLSNSTTVKLTESEQYRQAALRDPEFRSTEKLSTYRTYNFAPLLLLASQEATRTGNDVVVGFIGPNCQRLRIKLLSVRQDTLNPTRYYLAGKAKVLDHLSSFSGTLVLRQARELRQLASNGEAASTATQQAFKAARREGFVLADYELRENSGQPKCGVFRGVTRINWYVDKQNRLHYDYVYGEGDGYCNNQFVGTWTSYTTKKVLRCNWGDYRIPNSGDFDIGAGEFSPADKYLAFGWQDVRDAMDGTSAAARKREAQAWWK
jgi:hypothetical protein